MWFYQLTITNSYKFESNITALNNGKIVNKPKGYRFQIGDYLMYNEEKNCYYNLSYALIDNNGNKDKTSIIEFVGNEF